MKKEEFAARYHMGEVEREALARELFRLDFPVVLRQLRKRFGNVVGKYGSNVDPETVAIEAFSRFWERVHQYLQPSSSGKTAQTQTFITTIAEHMMLDRLRMAKAHRIEPEEEIIEDSFDPTHDPDGGALLRALDELARDRPLLFRILTFCTEGHSHREVAKLLNLEEGNIRRQVYDAREILNKLIEKHKDAD